ncbi:MAG: serine/threonine-protein kinase [Spirochaetia bacterium]
MAQQKIGKYTILKNLEQGGMARIYLARCRSVKQPVVLKKLTLTNRKEFKQRFEREAHLMHMFKNPFIVKVLDFFKSGASFYMAMEFVDGMSLDKLIRLKEVLSPTATALIAFQVCEALEYAHAKGVIHRDIKPANILIGKNGKVKLTDFGIATTDDTGSGERLTKTGTCFGTSCYMSPEQIESSKHVDERSDVYSLGVTLYEMMTGARPFKANFSSETITNIYNGKYVKPEKLNPAIPAKFRTIIKKAMCNIKESRYANIGKLKAALAPFLKKFKDAKSKHTFIKRYLAERT